MRKITAYIHEFMTDKVADALRDGNVHGVTVIKCEGFGRAASPEDGGSYLDSDVEIGFAPKTKIEIICRDEESDGIIELIQQIREIEGVHGVHVMAYRQESTVRDIIDRSGIFPRKAPVGHVV